MQHIHMPTITSSEGGALIVFSVGPEDNMYCLEPTFSMFMGGVVYLNTETSLKENMIHAVWIARRAHFEVNALFLEI